MISFCPAFLFLLCWITGPALATDGHQQDLAAVLTLFKEMMKLAKSAASGECFCSKAEEQVPNDAEHRQSILNLIQRLNDLVESEAAYSVDSAAAGESSTQHKDKKPSQKRVKRFHYGFRRQIAFPPGTKLSVTPTLYLPFVRDLPDGLISNMSISFPFSIFLDEIGLTDDTNIFGTFSILRRIYRLIFGHRKPRANDYSGGHRMLIYRTIENVLYNFGMEGRDCLLRAICEVHEFPLDHHHGLLGELLQFLFTASKSPDAGQDGLDYIRAELSGRERGECWQYYSKCPRSLFSHQDDNNLYM